MSQMIPDVASESLDFNNVKRRAMASRSYRVKLAPQNGSSFGPTSNSTIQFSFPSNLAGTYVDFTQCYLKFNVSFAGTANTCFALDKAGAYSFLQRVQAVTSGQSIFDLNNYNVLMTALMDTDCAPNYKAHIGNVLAGTAAAVPRGETLSFGAATNVSRTYCLPFDLHPFAMQKRLIPLFSLDSLRFNLMLESVTNALIVNAGSVTNYQLQDIELVCYFTELSPSAQAQIDAMTGGIYNILAPSYMNAQTTMGATITSVTATLGVAVSSLERLLVIHRPTDAAVPGGASLGARITNTLQTVQFFINSEAYPMRPLEVKDAGAEILAEYLISDHALSDFGKDSSICNQNVSGGAAVLYNVYDSLLPASYQGPNSLDATDGNFNAWNLSTGTGLLSGWSGMAAGATTVGSFIVGIELETGVSAGRSDRLYSGISTISSVVQYKGTYLASSIAANIDFFAYFTILLTLNMRSTGTWLVSV
jgi:hypothetical protein